VSILLVALLPSIVPSTNARKLVLRLVVAPALPSRAMRQSRRLVPDVSAVQLPVADQAVQVAPESEDVRVSRPL